MINVMFLMSMQLCSITLDWETVNHRTNGPANAHLIYVPNISTKASFAKFEIVVK